MAVAESYPAQNAFADLMNAQAQALGMSSTGYQFTGLPAEGHLDGTGSCNLARQIIYEHPDLYKIYSEKTFTYNDIKQENRNRLLWRDPSVDGQKQAIPTRLVTVGGQCSAR